MKNGGNYKDFGGYVEQRNYLLTSYPIFSTHNIFYYQNYGDFTDTTYFRKLDHPRAFTSSVLMVGEKKLLVINVHGIWTSSKLGDDRTIEQIRCIIEEVKRKDLPTVIVGDFNLLPKSSSIALMNKHFKNLISEFSISSTRPLFNDGLDQGGIVCDYIFVNDKVNVTNFQVLSTDISDHYPLILEFEI